MADRTTAPKTIRIDEKYSYVYDNGRVEIRRNGLPWLENPEAAKAWISAANELDELRRVNRLLAAENGELLAENLAHEQKARI